MRIFRNLLSDLTTLLLSLILALIIWAVAVRAADPIITKSLELEIGTRGLLPSEGVVTPEDRLVRITVEGPQSIVTPLTRSNFEAFIDLSEIPFGVSEAEIQIDFESEDLRIVFQDPRITVVNAEEIISREIPVVVQVRGNAARGHSIGEPVADPATILVSGPEDRVNQLQEAQITIFLDQPREDIVTQRRPTFIDRTDTVVSVNGLDRSTEEVVVVIPIDEIAGVADEPITVDWSGTPAVGYRLLNVRVEPNSLLVTGPPTVLESIRSISTEPIDISGLNASFTQQVSLVFPEGVVPDEVQPVFVTIEIEPIFTIDVVRRLPEMRALAAGLTARVEPEELSIFLYGPLPALDSIREGDVTVTLDLLDLGPGRHSIKPIVSVTAGDIEIRSTEPEFMIVIIEEESGEVEGTLTPTPSPTPTRRPTPQPTATP